MKINMKNVNPEIVNKKIKFPTMTYAPISKLGFNSLNRDRNRNHILSMSKKILDNGFMDIIKVFPENEKGIFEVAESQHRLESIKNILTNVSPNKVNVPIAILDWVDSADEDSVIRTIIDMNIGSKAWTVYDYTKTQSTVKNNPNSKDYAYILNLFREYNLTLTNNQVAQIFNNGEIPSDKWRKGLWELESSQKEFCNQMLYAINRIVQDNGKKNLKAMFLRSLITVLHKKLRKIKLLYSPEETLSKFISYLEYAISSVESQVSSPSHLPEGDEGVEDMLDVNARTHDLGHI